MGFKSQTDQSRNEKHNQNKRPSCLDTRVNNVSFEQKWLEPKNDETFMMEMKVGPEDDEDDAMGTNLGFPRQSR